jgi:F0F1-type ATP synthase membrane subunit b/b'
LYRPIIKRIEKDETELKQAQIQNKELEQQKNAFAEQKKKEIAEAKKRAREIIKEAENIAKGIKKETHKKANEETLALIKQTKDKLESLEPEIEKKVLERARARIGDSFQGSFLAALPLSLQKEIQSIFWKDFIKQIKQLTLKKLKEPELVEILKKFNLATKNNDGEKDMLGEEFEKIFAQKIGPVVLEYAYPLTADQEKKLEEIISEKSGIKLNFIKKSNKNLINGFRLEIAGMIIENNLLKIINDASNFESR